MTQLHQRKRSQKSLSDEYETPVHVIHELSKRHGIFPNLDVCSVDGMNKCAKYFSPNDNGLEQSWQGHDVWCNPPHSMTKEFVLKADSEWKKHNINIMMIIPANSTTTMYFKQVINNVSIFPIFGRITFLVDGKPMSDVARNGYFCVIWRKNA
jgi:phage N-6-adenine-methyltransferase